MTAELLKMELKLNPEQCASLVLLPNKNKGFTVVNNRPLLEVDVKPVPTMGVEDVYKVKDLGLKLGVGAIRIS